MEWVRPFFGFAWGAIGWDRVYCEGMRDTDLFQLALGLQSPWTVTRSEFAVEDGRLDLYVDFPRGSRFACAECGREGCAVHDTKDETWRHLDFFQHRTLLHARVPRVSCPNCEVRKVATPWLGRVPGSRCCSRPTCWRWPRRCRSPMRPSGLASTTRACGGSSSITFGARWRRWICLTCAASPPTKPRRGAATTISACSSTWRGAKSSTWPTARTPRR